MDVAINRLQRNLKIIKLKKADLDQVLSGKYNGGEIRLDEKYELTYQFVVELITWLVNTNDLLFKNFTHYKNQMKKDPEFKNTMFGLRHAFNLFKHNMSILSVEDRAHLLFLEAEDTTIYLESSIWLNVDGIPVDPDHENAKEAYVNYLEGKSVFRTLTSIVNKIRIYSTPILKQALDK